MRISLMTEGTYPTGDGGVSVWCDQLVRGMPDHEFRVQAIVATGSERLLWQPPNHVVTVNLVPLWGSGHRHHARRRDVERFRDAFEKLLDSLFRSGPEAVDTFLSALRELRPLARDGHLVGLMRSTSTMHALLTRWCRDPLPGRPLRPGEVVPAPRVGDATRAVSLLEHFLRPLGAQPDRADVSHAVSNGLASLIALVAKWECGTPFLLTEHGIYLRERYLEYRNNGTPFAVRSILIRFFRLLTTASYRQADLIAPASEYNRRWELRQGARGRRVVRVYNGIEPEEFPTAEEPPSPTVSWLGRITPIKDLETLIAAFRIVADRIPQARLLLFGSAPPGDAGYLARCVALIGTLGLTRHVSFEGRVALPADAYHAGRIVALSSTSEGFPYSVIEAMSCGRATVATDVGGVREAVGDTGIIVPPQDPTALADACTTLLLRHRLRRRMAEAAQRRARELFTVQQCVNAYRDFYRDLTLPVRSRSAHAQPTPAVPEAGSLPIGGATELRVLQS